jgi:hypothetical protein
VRATPEEAMPAWLQDEKHRLKTWISMGSDDAYAMVIMGVTQPGYDIHSLPWFFDGPNRNRCFTVLKNGDFPWLC